MASISWEQMVDFNIATFEAILAKKPAYTFQYENYDFHNEFWVSAVKQQGGDRLEGRIQLGDEGNAKHASIWDDSTHNIVNIHKRYTVNWVYSPTNVSWNMIEQDLNSGDTQIFDEIDAKYDNMCREWVDEVMGRVFLTPASSSDTLYPHGISAWLRQGTDDSTGGWTGYTATYGDGTSYYVGGLTCSSTENARFASYYADHNGNLDDSLLVLLDRASRKLNFRGPSVPKALDLNTKGYKPRFAMYSNDTVIGTLNQLYAKSDDQMGYRIEKHYGVPHFKSMPFMYVPVLDTADTNRYGTNPIFGINHKMLYPVVQPSNNWRIDKPVNRAAAAQPNLMTVYGHLLYQVFCVNPRHAGYLISQQ